MWNNHHPTSISHLLDVFHVAVDSNQGEIILCKAVEMQRWVHVWLALKVLGPPFVNVSVQMKELRRYLNFNLQIGEDLVSSLYYQRIHTCHSSPSRRSLETTCRLEAFWVLQPCECPTSHNWKTVLLRPSPPFPIYNWDSTFQKYIITSYNVSALVLSPMDSRYLA